MSRCVLIALSLVAHVHFSDAFLVGGLARTYWGSARGSGGERVSGRRNMARATGATVLKSQQTEAPAGPQERHPIYWIDECEPHEMTRELARKNEQYLYKFLNHKGIAPFNLDAFKEAERAYAAFSREAGGEPPIIIDSCCGTGRSTYNLARENPTSFVVGVDKSEVRLNRNRIFRESSNGPAENMILVRANCIDFWRLIWQAGWKIDRHFILYPNPYPKPGQHFLRWHGSPAFPILLKMGGEIEVRASWRTYLEEMAIAAEEIGGVKDAVIEPLQFGKNLEKAISNFERKYVLAGQPIYRLRFPRLQQIPFDSSRNE
ncbi:hypothetical protein GUITHDRAFT_103331 [Guillardia theta CCMP2712]|uniref:tRNA (guanine(46)-N(7))-methyltransferase n=1 Tax=Guillardia theta (strain CCMP2712) TaxID=905079 RepID=L1JRC5_GUITC|nr:hypothetical protein GUITHDRAFT_103331 [Guillardia theta CCMP2712]EKX50740.1 hypothetical protein GUITHDRAFT_103331 [Guillardia theta CCMP2712]|eukprot:XP_005837720.1 hypothetical protein GUITHDRAFT_103331 [Guillardia theta CCMP2712]